MYLVIHHNEGASMTTTTLITLESLIDELNATIKLLAEISETHNNKLCLLERDVQLSDAEITLLNERLRQSHLGNRGVSELCAYYQGPRWHVLKVHVSLQ